MKHLYSFKQGETPIKTPAGDFGKNLITNTSNCYKNGK